MGKVNSHSHSIIAQSPFFSTGFRHSRPSAVRASMCTRSGSLSKPVTDLGERDRKKENGQLKGCNRAEMIKERKTSLNLLWDTWYVGLHLLMACLLCISTQTTLRGPTQPSQAWTVILPAPRLQQQDYYDCSWGGKETWSPVKSEFCFNAEGHSSLMPSESKLKRGFIWLVRDMKDWVSWFAPGLLGKLAILYLLLPIFKRKTVFHIWWISVFKKVRKYSLFTPWPLPSMVLDNYEKRHKEFL